MTNKTVMVCALLLGGAAIWGWLGAETPPANKQQPATKNEQPAATNAQPTIKSARPRAAGMSGDDRNGSRKPHPIPRQRPQGGYKTWTGPAWVSTLPAAEQGFESRAGKALQRQISVDFEETPLADAAEFFAHYLGIPVQFDLKALEEPAIVPAETTVNFQVSQVSAAAALNQLLTRVDEQLTWILHNEVLLITTKTKADAQENFVRRVYPVRDLVATGDADDNRSDFDSLIDMIQSTVAPDTWGDAPGQGSVKAFNAPESLVVAHTADVQEQTTRLLKALRVAQALEDGNEKVLEQLKGEGEAAAPAAAAKDAAPPAVPQK